MKQSLLMTPEDLCFILTTLTFGLLFLVRVIECAVQPTRHRLDRPARILLWTGTLAAWGGILLRWYTGGHPPLTNMFESLITLVGMIGAAVIAFTTRYPLPLLEGLGGLLGVIGLGLASMFGREIRPPVPALQSTWLYLHVGMAFIGEVCFAIAFLLALLFLWQRWRESVDPEGRGTPGLPASSVLDDYTYRAIALGYPLYTVGALIFGAVWAQKAWGRFWSWDPKETWALVTFLVYSVYLHLRLSRGRTGIVSALVSVIGFLVTLFTLFGVNFLMKGLHTYASF